MDSYMAGVETEGGGKEWKYDLRDDVDGGIEDITELGEWRDGSGNLMSTRDY